VSTERLAVATKCAFLPSTGDVYDVKSIVSTTSNKWFQNRFNEFLAHINHMPLFPLMFMYLQEELGANLLP
jgi:hypothetical protein